MNSIKYETGSFRDPSGRIFYKDNKVYREISSLGKDRYKFIKNSVFFALNNNLYEICVWNGF